MVGDAEVVVQGRGTPSEGEEAPAGGGLPPTLEEYLQTQFEGLKRHGVKVEIVAKRETLGNYTTYFAQTVYLPVILEGNFSTKVWVN